jgi:hypothetical protein
MTALINVDVRNLPKEQRWILNEIDRLGALSGEVADSICSYYLHLILIVLGTISYGSHYHC